MAFTRLNRRTLLLLLAMKAADCRELHQSDYADGVCIQPFGKCGGSFFNVSGSCCDDNSQCVVKNFWFAQCLDEEWAAIKVMQGWDGTVIDSEEMPSDVAGGPLDDQGPHAGPRGGGDCEDDECVARFEQCGGGYNTSVSCCEPQTECIVKNWFYAQCLTEAYAAQRVGIRGWDGRVLHCEEMPDDVPEGPHSWTQGPLSEVEVDAMSLEEASSPVVTTTEPVTKLGMVPAPSPGPADTSQDVQTQGLIQPKPPIKPKMVPQPPPVTVPEPEVSVGAILQPVEVEERVPETRSPAEEPTAETVEEPAEAPFEELAEEPAAVPVEEAVEESLGESIEPDTPTEEPAEAPFEEPAEAPFEEPEEEPLEEPIEPDTPTEEPAEEPFEEPEEEALEEPIEPDTPTEEPAEAPIEEPEEEALEEPIEPDTPTEEPSEEPVELNGPTEEPLGESTEPNGPPEVPVEEPELREEEFTFKGDLTYYGGAGEAGHCTQTHVPEGYTTVALNAPQYAGGSMCGTCVYACFDNLELGQGERCFEAIIDDECPECLQGDLDLGELGSGRWDVDWFTVECPEAPDGLLFTTQGSNPWYAKVKAQGGPSAIETMTCNGLPGFRTADAFFEFLSSTGQFACGMDCEVVFSRGFGTGSGQVSAAQLGDSCI